MNRGIAQSGSAPALGAGCRGFKSLYPDQLISFVTAKHSYLGSPNHECLAVLTVETAPVAQSDRASAF